MHKGRKVSEYDFPERMNVVRPSGIRELFDAARGRADRVDLSIGQADFDVPEPIRAATIAAIEEGCGRYSPSEGFPELVAATTAFLRERFALPEDEQVMTTSGASGALTLAMLALVGPGDEVLLPDPHFVVYRNLVHIAGACPTYYDLYPDFRL
ncbi:MAG: aminotransferase class I/II-fold pyridoxal phosphate-dependent enzyme, partial [Deltaproteobacteria bacterium]|nr:aminotransferase class I/II-fold pyridoxal phosphate-dependent enzyme [Deltaproteobacteria bacterium]